MSRPVLLALIAALSLPAAAIGAVPAASGSPVEPAAIAETSLLTVGGAGASGFASPSLDVAIAVAIDRDRTGARLERYALEERLRRAPDDDARRAILLEAATDVRLASADLRAEAGALRAGYANGSVDAGAFLRGLVRLQVRAALLSERLEVAVELSEDVPGVSLRGRSRRLAAALAGHRGPVRDRALGAYRGATPAGRVYLAASSVGVALATIDDGRYVREAYRADQRTDEPASGFGLDEVVSRTAQLYPTAYNDSVQTSITGLAAGVFRVTLELADGRLVAYFDGGTRNVFYEVREHGLGGLRAGDGVDVTENGTTLVVNRSFPGGPMRVATYDAATGEPVRSTVVVAGHRVATGPDGVAWTLAPGEERFTVTASVGGDRRVSVRVRPLQPIPVNQSG